MYFLSYFVNYFSYPLGALHDASGNYYGGFYLAGSFVLASGLLFLSIPCIQHMKKKRNAERHPLVMKKSATAIITSAQTLHSALEWQLGILPPEHMAEL